MFIIFMFVAFWRNKVEYIVFTDPGVNDLFYDCRHDAKIRYWTIGAQVVQVKILLF